MKTTLSTVLMLSVIICSAQFSSKKEEKFFNKLDDAYFDYDYATILENEDKIKELFLNRSDTVSARAYTFLAEAYEYEYGDLDKALEYYTEEYKIRKVTDPENAGNVLFNVASLSMDLGRTKDAENLYLELVAADLNKFGKKDAQYWDSEISLLDFYSFSGQPEKGLEVSKRLKKVLPRNSVENAIRMKSEGDFLEMSGEFTKSERALRQSLKIFESNDMYASLEYVGALNSLATLYTNTGKLPQAEELYLESQSIVDRLGESAEELAGGITNNLARLYYLLGNYDQAEQLYTGLLAEDLEYYGEESANYGLTAFNLGLNQLYAGEYAEARKFHNLARQVFDVALEESDPINAYWNNNMALLSTRTGDPDLALEYGKQAIEKHEEILGPNNVQTAFPYFNMGDAHMAIDELDKATEYHLKALEIRKNSVGKKHPFYAISTNQLAILEWKKGNHDEALKYFQETFENYYNQINSYFPILSEEEKTKFYYNKLRPTVEQFNAFVIKAGLDDPTLRGQMYDLQLTLKGIILSATTKVKQSILTSGDSVLIGKYEEWLGQKEKLAQLFSDSQLSESERDEKIATLTTSSDNLEKELSKLSAGFAKTIEDKVTWDEVRGKLKEGEAAIEMVRFRDFSTDSAGVFTDEVYYAALIVRADSEDHPEMIVLRDGKGMEKKSLSTYRNSIKYKIDETRSYVTYWRPLANRLKDVNKIYFSPDGVYNQISIYTLKNPETKKFLIDEINIQLVNNTKDLLKDLEARDESGTSVFFGFPNYNMGSVEQEQEAEEVATKGGASSVVKAASENRGTRGSERGGRGGRGSGGGEEIDLTKVSIPRGLRGNMLRYMRSNSLLVLLPGTKKEVELIDSLYDNRNIKREVYLSDEAIEERIKEISNPQSVHVATHGFFLEDHGGSATGQKDGYVENPLLRSGLILAGANSFIRSGEIGAEIESDEDGILTAYEAMNLPLDDTEIVVLSACETGLGEVKNGEGVFGLQRAFQIAGAKSIIMSMWTVDDAATQELMTGFYEEWLKSGDKHQAFNVAQKKLKDKWKSPYYWGAFVMVGR